MMKYSLFIYRESQCFYGWFWKHACNIKQMEVKVLCTSLDVPVPLPYVFNIGEIFTTDMDLDAYCVCQ